MVPRPACERSETRPWGGGGGPPLGGGPFRVGRGVADGEESPQEIRCQGQKEIQEKIQSRHAQEEAGGEEKGRAQSQTQKQAADHRRPVVERLPHRGRYREGHRPAAQQDRAAGHLGNLIPRRLTLRALSAADEFYVKSGGKGGRAARLSTNKKTTAR